MVKKIINSEWPIGHLVTPKDRIDNYFPPIVEEGIWAKARKQTQRLKSLNLGKTGHQGGKKGYNIFTHIARDAQTNEGMQSRTWGKRKYLLPASVRYGRRKGAAWNLAHFEDLFFRTIRMALDVDRTMDLEELELTKTQQRVAKVDASLVKLTDLIAEEPDFDVPEIKVKMVAMREEKKALTQKEQTIREQIMAGNSLTLDPDEKDREVLRRAVRANVKTIHMNNDEKWFEVELQNGIRYTVTCHKAGEVEVSSDDFKVSDLLKVKPHPTKRNAKAKA